MTPSRDAVSSTICVQTVSIYGRPGVLARPRDYALDTSNHEPGGPQSISARLLSKLSGREISMILAWASTGKCFIKLEWTFPGCTHPAFTTRHRLVPDEIPGGVSFRDDLAWAEKMLKAAGNLGITRCLAQGRREPSQLYAVDTRNGPRLYQQPSLPHWFSQRSLWMHRFGTNPPAEEEEEVPDLTSEPDTESTMSDASTVFSSDLEDGRACGDDDDDDDDDDWGYRNSHNIINNNIKHTHLAQQQQHQQQNQQQIQLETEGFRRQRIAAEALYAQTGDTSGLLAVLAAASQARRSRHSSGVPII
ncbi:hypothetical protein C8A00DRAFT_32443 [Chaetomidium leptoderma]|uniref:Uncharacterized protein n=1 Tax=Chaetomidium leptoderma TaxID=669021 RepID=A0AAN6VNC1_9PEZI|nr:hypothetical protein C8A00DRAFT_32443 [Chaetomidium leptoderma]